MIEWTETARRALDDYCARSKAALSGTGVDVEEVVDDLRRHIDHEINAAGLKVVTEADLRRLLARFGEPGRSVDREAETTRSVAAATGQGKDKKRPGYFLLVFGILLPLATLVFELATGVSAGLLFDPVPGWFQVGAVALVPAVNFWIWRAGRGRDSRYARGLGWFSGMAIGISLFYAVLYLPVTPFALLGLIYFGAGLIPLTPMIATVATSLLRLAYARRINREKLPGGLPGGVVGFGFLVLLQLPTALTYYGLDQAASEDPAVQRNGIRVLRRFGDQELMLRACYGLLRREVDFDLVRGLASGNRNVAVDTARQTYYRVTGKPFNSVPSPSLYTRAGRWDVLDEEFTWDDALGGEAVAGRVKGLSLLSSRMDAVTEPAAALVYCEWTMEFKNVATQPREARAQILLPPGAVVSRLTLWVNGEEREAAFGGRSQVRQAYQNVAVVRRRDPVLVTTCGPDRILLQCFPVPADGGVMKVRLGITAPLALESLERGRFCWPHFLERNFSVAPAFQHGLALESPVHVTGGPEAHLSTNSATHPFILRDTASETALDEESNSATIYRPAEVTSVWTPADENGRVIRQTIQPGQPFTPARLVLIVDGSAGMQKFASGIVEALSGIPQSTEIAVVLAGDDPKVLNGKPEKVTPVVLQKIGEQIRNASYGGGQDNIPALEVAWDLAAAVENGVVVWIHKPQAALISPESTLRQTIERTATGTRLLELQTGNGPDRIIEKLDGLKAVERVSAGETVQARLSGLGQRWSGQRQGYELKREQVPAVPETTSGPQVSRHLERLWARDEAQRLTSHRDREAATKLAVSQQLVTPLTGAVVLETQQQFSEHGLTPADSKTVPAVPEPGTLSLLICAGAALVVLRSKRKAGHAR